MRFRASWFGYSTGLLITGTAAAVVLACTIRFLALAEGAVRSGMEKLPPNLDEAARSLGRTPLRSALAVLLPLLSPAILTALVLVFVDTIKELSATILLQAVRLQHAGDLRLRERLARGAGGRRARGDADHRDRAGPGRAAVRRADARPRSLDVSAST